MMRDCIVSHPWYQGKNSLFYSDILSPAYIVFICNKDSDVHPLTQIIEVCTFLRSVHQSGKSIYNNVRAREEESGKAQGGMNTLR